MSQDSLPPPVSRRFLYLTAAVAGAAVLIVEILGARLLAPWLGTSHFVWTAQIVVTLIALALGYEIGGRLADRRPRLGLLYALLAGAGVWIAVSSRIVEPVGRTCLALELASGSLVASTVLYLGPLALLATVGPFLARIVTNDLALVGGRVGRLLAVGTLGSVAGAFLVGYVLIPLLPYSLSMMLTGAALVATSAAWSWTHRGGASAVAATAATAILVAGVVLLDEPGAIPPGAEERHREDGPYGRIQVVDTEEGMRHLVTDLLIQNVYDPVQKRNAAGFATVLHTLAVGHARPLESALCIGLGIGWVPRRLAEAGVRVDAVEIDPAVVRVAVQWFDLDLSHVNVVVADGRRHLERLGRLDRTYDVVVLDAFAGDSSPSHLLTREAFAAMRRVLRDGGVLVINAFADPSEGDGFLGAALHRTLKAVFPHVRFHAGGTGNAYLVASNRPLGPTPTIGDDEVHPRCAAAVRYALANVIEPDPTVGLVLTDDRNPADALDSERRERMRRGYVDMVTSR